MNNGATKAAPRDKAVALQQSFYLVTQSPHFIGGKIEPVGAIVRLPKGVTPGKKLVECDAEGTPIEKAAKSAETEESEEGESEKEEPDKPAKPAKPAKGK